MIKGIPFSKKVNLFDIFNNNYNKKEIKSSLYDLTNLITNSKKNYVVMIDGEFLTWLDDICYDYFNKECFIPYYSFKKLYTDIELNKKLKSAEHLLTDDFDNIIVRFEYKLNKYKIDCGSHILTYSIKDNSVYDIVITNYIDGDFKLSKLYTLYKQACYYDMESEFSSHEPGYTFITAQFKGFRNQEYSYRRKIGLDNYDIDSEEISDYSDVRYYDYLKYIDKFKKIDLQNLDIFKYRNLMFEAYLFCNLKQNNNPVDNNKWNKLGVSTRYIKIKDDVPFFIKYYWLDNYRIKNSESWLDL